MNQSPEFARGVAYALQTVKDFQDKYGQLELDAIAAETLSHSIRDHAVIFHAGKFHVVRRKKPHGKTYEFIEQ